MVLLWFLSQLPGAAAGATGPAIQYSLAGRLGQALQPRVRADRLQLADRDRADARAWPRARWPWARWARSTRCPAAGDAVADSLAPIIAQGWSLATGLSLLAWYVFAPQCISTLAVTQRETNSWRYPLLMLAYMFALAYLAAFVTYRVTLWLGGG